MLPGRAHQLHGALRPWPDLHAHEQGALRNAATAADGGAQRFRLRHQVHRLHRGGRRRDHRHLGCRPRAYRAGRRGERRQGRRHRQPRPHLPADGPAWRCAGPCRPHRGCMRPGAHGRLRCQRRDLRDHERRRHHGPPPGAGSLRRAAWHQDRHHRRPDPLPDDPRAHHRACFRAAAGHRAGPVQSGDLPRQRRGHRAHGADHGRYRPRAAHPGARAQHGAATRPDAGQRAGALEPARGHGRSGQGRQRRGAAAGQPAHRAAAAGPAQPSGAADAGDL